MRNTIIALCLCLIVTTSGCGRRKQAETEPAYTPQQTQSNSTAQGGASSMYNSNTSYNAGSAATGPSQQPEQIALKSVANTESDSTGNATNDRRGKIIIGATEDITFPTYGITLAGRIDTGATTTSIDARNVQTMERDGRKWVRFELDGKRIELPVQRTVNIKRHGADPIKRYSVNIKLKAGSIEQLTEVTLADRSSFTYPVLIGRNFLKDQAVVDVSAQNHKAGTNK